MKARALIEQTGTGRAMAGLGVAAAAFILLGTVAALWQNPFFVRMTPAGDWEIALLALLALLTGAYVTVRRPFCSNKTMGAGGVLAFVGIACPVCNQILLLVFGSELLLTYFEPIRVYVAALGVVIAAWAVVYELRRREGAAPREAPALPG
ncbi:MAG TPA: hypothetical protein ENH05_06560 [Rhizobiales bacterium]|nr:hypothetical protein [Hyphomicrobiales bacterium]